MKRRKYWEIGGFLAGGLMIVFGIVAIFMGVNGYNTTRDSIKGEGITFGAADDPAVAKYAEQWAGQQVKTGDQARAFAKVMRMHTLESTGGLAYRGDGPLPSALRSQTIRRAPATRQPQRRALTVSRSRTEPGTSGSPRPRSRRR